MNCKYCETENPEGSVYCLHCGKRLDGKIFCPSCKSLCPEEALYCNACGARIMKAQPATETAEPEEPQSAEVPQTTVVATPKAKSGAFETVKKVFDLSGGICLMFAVLFAFVFTFCMGLTATASGSYLDSSLSETTMMWKYFGEAYKNLAETLGKLEYYSAYYEISAYIPIVLSTVICAATLVCVLVFTILAAVNYGRHFKKPEVKYGKFGIAAVFSFILGAAAFLAVNSTAFGFSSLLKVTVRFSDATIAGIVLSLVFLWLFLVSRVVMLGKEFVTKRAIVNFVCTLAGILFTVLVLSFASSPAFILKEVDTSSSNSVLLNFSTLNITFANAFPEPDKLSNAMETNFTVTYVASALAQGVQIALLVLAFVLLIKRAAGLGGDSKSCLGVSIATIALAAVQLALTITAIVCGNALIASETTTAELKIEAAVIVAFIASGFALADAITHKVLLSKTAQR